MTVGGFLIFEIMLNSKGDMVGVFVMSNLFRTKMKTRASIIMSQGSQYRGNIKEVSMP